MPIRSIDIAVLLLCTGCEAASGSVEGGQPLLCPRSNGGSTWTDLYADYFGPCGSAGCAGNTADCHLSENSTGAQSIGFICGATQESCWEGMVLGIAPDAGGVFAPIVTGGELVSALRKSRPSGRDLDNMPCGSAALACPPSSGTYAFTPADLARISSWIQQGAQDN